MPTPDALIKITVLIPVSTKALRAANTSALKFAELIEDEIHAAVAEIDGKDDIVGDVETKISRKKYTL